MIIKTHFEGLNHVFPICDFPLFLGPPIVETTNSKTANINVIFEHCKLANICLNLAFDIDKLPEKMFQKCRDYIAGLDTS